MIKLIVLLLIGTACLALPDQSNDAHEPTRADPSERQRIFCPKYWYKCQFKLKESRICVPYEYKTRYAKCVESWSDNRLKYECQKKLKIAKKNKAVFVIETNERCDLGERKM